MGSHFLLRGLFLTKGSNLLLLHWQAASLPLNHQGQLMLLKRIIACIMWTLIVEDVLFHTASSTEVTWLALRQVSLSKFIVCFHIISYICVQKLSSWKLFEGEVCFFSSGFFFFCFVFFLVSFFFLLFNGGLAYKMEKEMATCSSICAWRIPWIEELGGLWSIGSQRFGYNWSNLECMHHP